MKEAIKRLALTLVERLKEKSTWAFILGVLPAVGVAVNPELNDQIINAGMAVSLLLGSILAATPDKK